MPSEKFDQVRVLNDDASLDGIAVKQKASGSGAALRVDSDSTSSPALVVQGSGDLLDLRDATGASQFSVSNVGNLTYSGTSTITGDQAVTGTFTVTGDVTVNGGAVFNEASADEDFRVESNGNANMLFVDGGTDRVGVGNNAPTATLEVTGTLYTSDSALGIPGPADHGIVAWSSDPTNSVNNTVVTNGTVYLTALYIPRAVAVTKIYFHLTTSAVTPTAGQNEVGLYSSAGTLLDATNVDGDLSGAGLKTITIDSQSLTAGSFVWVGMVFNAGTAPGLGRASGQAGIGEAANVGLTAATYRYATNGTSQTTLPASITPASNTGTVFAGPWVAIGA